MKCIRSNIRLLSARGFALSGGAIAALIVALALLPPAYAALPSAEELGALKSAYTNWARENMKLNDLELQADKIEIRITTLKEQLRTSPNFIQERQLESLLRRSHDVLLQIERQSAVAYALLETYRARAIAYNTAVLTHYNVTEQNTAAAAACARALQDDLLVNAPVGLYQSSIADWSLASRLPDDQKSALLKTLEARQRYCDEMIRFYTVIFPRTSASERAGINRRLANYRKIASALASYRASLESN